MKKLILATVLLMSSNAFADGFVCETADGLLNIKVYNNVQPSLGTRTGAVMIVSDPTVQYGRKTIARFTDVSETLESSGSGYLAGVDLRFADSKRKGELLLGTKLGQLKSIALDVDFSYASPVAKGSPLAAYVTATKRDGSVKSVEATCIRYLKGE